jgi:hypothetical protein
MFRQLSMRECGTRVSAVAGKGALLLGLLVGLTQSAARADLSDYSAYAIFGDYSVSVGNNVTVSRDNSVSAGTYATVSGGFVGSNGTVTFGDYANVTQGVNAPISVTFGASPVSTGTVYTDGSFTIAGVSPSPVPSGSFVTVNPLTPVTFTPGEDVFGGDDNSLVVGQGDHYYGYFIVGDRFNLTLDPNGGKIRMFFGGDVIFGNNLKVTLSSGSAEDIYAQTDASWTFGDNSNWVGTIYAPNDTGYISAGSGFTMTGALYGSDVSLGTIPAPGALVLGAMGIGMVGWLRRRV